MGRAAGTGVAHLVEGRLGDFAHLLVHILVLGEPVGEHQTHVGGLAELAALGLLQLAQGGDGIGLRRLLDDPAEGGHGFGELDEEADGGVAGSCQRGVRLALARD